jgi:hypothetical protein
LGEAPGDFTIRDISGATKTLARHEHYQAATTLGVDIAPDGNWSQQQKKMIIQANTWADQIRMGKLQRDEVWLALNSSLWKTLTYPFDAMDLTEEECKAIMHPALD